MVILSGKKNMDFHVQLLSFAAIVLVVTGASSNLAKPGCNSTCGNLTIPFPFGTTPGCYLEDKSNLFLITCKETGPPQSFMSTSNVEVRNVTLDGEITVSSFFARACFNESGAARDDNIDALLRLPKFPISNTRNKFNVVGCSTTGLIWGTRGDHNYTTGCVSICDTAESVVNGSCDGSGCCQSSIPDNVTNFRMTISNPRSNEDILATYPCSYAFVAEENYYKFSTLDLKDLQGRNTTPVVLDWAVGNEVCEYAKKNQSSYACQASNSECVDSSNGPGYRCKCSSGFEGNPYLLDGCQNINECSLTSNTCVAGACKDNVGNYSCSCPSGYDGDGEKSGSGCTKKSKDLQVALGVSLSFLAIVVGSSSIYCLMAKRKIVKLREKYFNQNGGFMLQDELSKHQGSVHTARIFSAEDLKNATNNYDESRVIGQGGFGTVYKGLLKPNNKEVAIKKSKVSDQSQIEQFINEVIILTQINHRNVVKLLGCCLETEVPLLVYEFITNGTLSDHLYDNDTSASFLSWEMRMKIAAETAGAVAYLHSATSTPIIHRDIKSTNILLDENYTAKVADFGASKLVPLDKTQLTTLVQGTFGYLDPEYFHSSQLTEKSDVYSFGVLLAELLTGEKALSFERPEKDRNLATYFVCSVRNGHSILDIVDKRLMEVGKVEQIKEVAKLTAKCLRLKGDERPSMKEVAMELEGLKVMMEHLNDSTSDHKETEYLLNQSLPSEAFGIIVDSSSNAFSSTTGFDSMIHQMATNLQLR